MEDLETITNHNPEDETYCYHATTSLEDAKRIIEEGFYSYSKDLESTSFPEFTVDQILTYSYGNGIENFGDYIIVLSVPKGEDIVEESVDIDDLLSNCDDYISDEIKVPKVVD